MNQIKKEDNKLSDDPIRNEASRLTLIKFGIEDENVSTIPNSIFQILKSVYNFKTDLLSREATKKPNCKLLSNKLSNEAINHFLAILCNHNTSLITQTNHHHT